MVLAARCTDRRILWADSDTRTLIEIDHEDVSTDLAQHIITHEHVLLDLAPGLGCACSGAIGSVPSRSARVTVTALEPPRAFGPIIDPTPLVSLDVPVGEQPTPVPLVGSSPEESQHDVSQKSRLDEVLGGPDNEHALEIDVEVALHTSGLNFDDPRARPIDAEPPATVESAETPAVATPTDVASAASPPPSRREQPRSRCRTTRPSVGTNERNGTHHTSDIRAFLVRRRTRHRCRRAILPRHPASDRERRRKRYLERTWPSGGLHRPASRSSSKLHTSGWRTSESRNEVHCLLLGSSLRPSVDAQPAVEAPVGDEPPSPVENVVNGAEQENPVAAAPGGVSLRDPRRAQPRMPERQARRRKPPRPEPKPAGGAVTATDTNPSALVALLVALIALGFFVFRALN
jgi:hypothetical protein